MGTKEMPAVLASPACSGVLVMCPYPEGAGEGR